MLNATELLNDSVDKHAHWLILDKCADWVQEQCRAAPSELENEALMTLLAGIRSWLQMRRYSDHELRKITYAQQRRAISEEISGSTMQRTREIPFEIRSYAFTQHAVREFRAHTSMWADARKANAPSGLLGRAGQEHTRTTASEMMERQAHWPFHLAGDSGAQLLNHRAWKSLRCLALFELCAMTLSELPVLSTDLQALIEATRSSAETGASLSAETVQEILLSFCMILLATT